VKKPIRSELVEQIDRRPLVIEISSYIVVLPKRKPRHAR
jgi:hypothetical protein